MIMAILKIKRLNEDLENNSTLVLSAVAKATSSGNAGTALKATSAGEAGTALKATSAGEAGTALKATSAGNSGTTRVAHYASSGTAALAGTNAIYATGL